MCHLPSFGINSIGGKEETGWKKQKIHCAHKCVFYVPKKKVNNEAMWLTMICLPGSDSGPLSNSVPFLWVLSFSIPFAGGLCVQLTPGPALGIMQRV